MGWESCCCRSIWIGRGYRSNKEEYYCLSCKVDFGIVGEEHKVELNNGRRDGMLGFCQVSPFLRAVRT